MNMKNHQKWTRRVWNKHVVSMDVNDGNQLKLPSDAFHYFQFRKKYLGSQSEIAAAGPTSHHAIFLQLETSLPLSLSSSLP